MEKPKKRTLSGNEAKLILQLEWEGKTYFTAQEVIQNLHCSKSYAYFLIHRLKEKAWIEPVERGKYLLISAMRGKKPVPDMNPYIVIRILDEPYYFSSRQFRVLQRI